jgi:hypothetical protein
MEGILSNNLYNTIPSIATGKGWYVHARSDHPEIRAKFFELLRGLSGYKAHIVVAKKELTAFNRKHNNNPTEFYFDVLHHLLNGRIKNDDCQYSLYLAQRGNNSLHRFQQAVSKALESPGGDPMATNCVLEIVPSGWANGGPGAGFVKTGQNLRPLWLACRQSHLAAPAHGAYSSKRPRL